MSKLFAMENDDLAVSEGVSDDIAPETAEIAEIQIESGEEMASVGEDASAVEAGAEAGEQLGEVQDLLETAVEEGEGLTPVAAEAVRLAVEAICMNIGADPKRVYSLYATENFQAQSSRLANTKIALEGVDEFLKDLWKRVKAALERMWKKMKAFWDKHISDLGRIKKTLNDTKKKISSAGNKLVGSPVLDSIPSSLARAFDVEGQLKTADVMKTISNAADFLGDAAIILSKTTEMAKTGGGNREGAAAFERKHSGLVNGVTISIKVEDEDDEDGKVSYDIEREDSEKSDVDGSKGMIVPKKEDLNKVLADAITAIDLALDFRKNYTKSVEAMNKALQDLGTKIQDQSVPEDESKKAAKYLTSLSRLGSWHVKLSAAATAENVKAAKAAIAYISLSLKSYKK